MTGLLVGAFFSQGFARGLLTIAIAVTWAFALYDLATSSLSGRKKAVWLVLILIFPLAGAIVYLLVRADSKMTSPAAADQMAGVAQHAQDPRMVQMQHPGA